MPGLDVRTKTWIKEIRKREMDVRTGRESRYSRKASAVIGELGYLMLAK